MSPLTSFDTHSPKPENVDKVYAAWSDPDNYRLGAVVDDILPRRGRGQHSRFPSAVHLLSHEGAKVFGSGPEYFKTIRRRALYAELRGIAREVGDLDLPEDPPNGEGARHWRLLVAPRRRSTSAADFATLSPALQALRETHAQLGLARAADLGGFPADLPFDPAHPDPRQFGIVDGTMGASFSRVSVIHSGGLDHLVNSRATTGPPRLQSIVHHKKKDGRKYAGINYVVLLADTASGWVTIGVDRALGGENVTAVSLIEAAAAKAPGFRGVLSDRMIVGWPSSRLLRELGLVCYHLPVAQHETSEEVAAARLSTQSLLAARGIHAGLSSPPVKELALLAMEAEHDGEALLPLGKSVYTNSMGRLVVVDSVAIPLDLVEHHAPTAAPHEHLLYVDDDSLVEVRYVDGRPFKVQRAAGVLAEVIRDPDGSHALHTRWQLDCTAGPFEVDLVWRPSQGDCEPHQSTRPDRQRALARLAPISRADGAAMDTHGIRSRVEAYFSRYDAAQGRGGFAMYLDLDHQLLDFIAFAQLTNSLALHASRFAGPAASTQRTPS